MILKKVKYGYFDRFNAHISMRTLQFSDYAKYSSGMFDAAHKKAVHETQFPRDLERAFAFGKEIAQGA